MVYFVEGNSRFADENTKIGELAIRGTDITRTLKEGERVEVRVRVDESRLMKGTVYVPLIDEDFKVNLVSSLETPDYDDLSASLDEARSTLATVERHVDDEEQERLLQAGRQIEQIEATFERAERGEPGEAERIHKQLSDAKANLRPLKEKYGLIARHASTLRLIERTEGLCERFGESMSLAKLKDLREDADKALRLEQEKTLDATLERVRDLFWPLYMRTRECWEEQIEILEGYAPRASDPLAFHEHLHGAEKAFGEGDYQGCKLHVMRAWRLLPEDGVTQGRFHDAGLKA
jgi:molecular chaperone DnaK